MDLGRFMVNLYMRTNRLATAECDSSNAAKSRIEWSESGIKCSNCSWVHVYERKIAVQRYLTGPQFDAVVSELGSHKCEDHQTTLLNGGERTEHPYAERRSD